MRLLSRALNVLTILGSYPAGLSLQELCNRSNIPLASMHRILGSLEEQEFVTRSQVNKKFHLGPSLKTLSKDRSATSFLSSPPTSLIDAAQSFGETAFLTKLIDRNVVCISIVEGKHNLRLYVRMGQEMPIQSAASARAILAYANEDLIDAIMLQQEIVKLKGNHSGVGLTYKNYLRQVSERGFDVCDKELDDDVWAVSAPIYDLNGEVTMAVTIAGASIRLSSVESRVRATATVLATAREMSKLGGFQVPKSRSNSLNSLEKFYSRPEFDLQARKSK